MKIVFKTLNSEDPICFILPNMSITKVNHCMTYKARHSVKKLHFHYIATNSKIIMTTNYVETLSYTAIYLSCIFFAQNTDIV